MRRVAFTNITQNSRPRLSLGDASRRITPLDGIASEPGLAMTTLTEIVAAVVVHSSTVALSHFGVTLEPAQIEKPSAPAERVVARTPQQHRVLKLTSCPQRHGPPRALKV
jgi:hypothetical protein